MTGHSSMLMAWDGAGQTAPLASSARRLGEEGRRLHYFGNLDPWRMVANSRFEAELTPPCDGVRWDPFDNQMGEASVAGRGCDDNEMRRTIELVEIRALQ